MAENYVLEGFKMIGQKIGGFYQDNKPHILTGIGIGGTILTGVTAASAGARSAQKIDRRREELGRDLSIGEKFQLCWKDAILPTAVCGLGCFAEFRSDRAFSKIITERTALLVASEKAYERLSQKTKEVLGEKKAKQVRDEIAKEDAKEAITQEKLDVAPRVGNGELHPFMDGYSKILF